MANPYEYDENALMKDLRANHERLEEEARRKRNAGNMSAAVAASSQNNARIQEEKDIARGLLISKNLVLIDTNADGNCFYYAIQGYGHIKNIDNLSVGSGIMRKNLSTFIRNIESKSESFENDII